MWCGPRGLKEWDTTEQLNSNNNLGGALVPAKELRDIFWASLEEEPGPCPKAGLLFPVCFSFVSASPPSHN